MIDQYGKFALAVGAVLLFFALMKSEFLLWGTSEGIQSLAYSPVPFIAGGVLFLLVSLMAYKKVRRHNLENNGKTSI